MRTFRLWRLTSLRLPERQPFSTLEVLFDRTQSSSAHRITNMDDWSDWKHVLNAADIASARLIVQLQTEDARAVRPTSRPWGHTISDADLARQLYQEELSQLQADLPNRQLGEEIEENQNDYEEAFEAAAFGWKLKQWEGEVEHVREPVKPVECIACSDEFQPDDALHAPCGHSYCRACLEGLYTACMTDETLFRHAAATKTSHGTSPSHTSPSDARVSLAKSVRSSRL